MRVMNSLAQFFDDLRIVVRLRFSAIGHYEYSLFCLLFLLLPVAFHYANPKLIKIFAAPAYAYTYFYLALLLQLSIYATVFSRQLFHRLTYQLWRCMFSFLSLFFFIGSLALVFQAVQFYDGVVLVQLFSIIAMCLGLSAVSKRPLLTVVVQWILAFFLFFFIQVVLLSIALNIGIIDKKAYPKLTEELTNMILNSDDQSLDRSILEE